MLLAATLLLLLTHNTRAAAQEGTLPLVAEYDGDTTTAWWTTDAPRTDPLAPVWTGLKGHDLIIPTRKDLEHPRLSRIYKTPRLSRANAANVARLYKARAALIGSLKHTHLPPTAQNGFDTVGVHRHHLDLAVELVSSRNRNTIFSVAWNAVGLGQSAKDARRDALATLEAELPTLLQAHLTANATQVGLERSEPFLVVTGLRGGRSLQRLTDAIARLDGVKNVEISWTAASMVALDIDPGRVQTTKELVAALIPIKDIQIEGLALELNTDTQLELVVRDDDSSNTPPSTP